LRVDDDALAGEREEWLKDIILQVSRWLSQFIQEECGRCIGVVYKGKGEFADAVEPVGMCNPLDIEVLADIEVRTEGGGGLVELVENDSIIDAPHACFALGDGVDIE